MILKNGKRIDGCSDTVPIGSLNPFLGTAAPYGYLICAGQLVSKTAYPELYTICGDTYGTATATEFYLPDLRGRTIVGYKEGDTDFGTLGGLVGSVTSATGNHTLTVDEMPKHTHSQNQWIFNGSSASGNHYGYGWQANTGTMYNGMPSDWSSNGQTGGSGAHNHGSVSTIQPSINLNWIVKAFMLMPNQSYVANATQESSVNTYSCDYINDNISNGTKLNENLRITDGSYYNLPLDTIAKKSMYSTDEIIVGAWIDGKPVYRRVFSGTFDNGQVLLSGIKNLVSASGTLDPGTGIQRQIPYYEIWQNNPFCARVDIYQNNVRVDSMNNGTQRNCNGTIILEYTKTTD